MSESILLEREHSVALITLNRPEVGNAFDIPMARDLLEVATQCAEDPKVRCVLLTGAGRLFCSGGDVVGFAGAGEELPAHLMEITTVLHSALIRFACMAKPMVVAVNGPAAGAGIGTALIGDIVLAAPEAHFTLAYTAIGMSPDAGATWLLPRLVGMRRAQVLILQNKRLTAADAAAIGLITRVTQSGMLAEEAIGLARDLAAGATAAFGAARRLLAQSFETSLETQLEAESRTIAGLGRSRDGREGIAAFTARRRPDFTGG